MFCFSAKPSATKICARPSRISPLNFIVPSSLSYEPPQQNFFEHFVMKAFVSVKIVGKAVRSRVVMHFLPLRLKTLMCTSERLADLLNSWISLKGSELKIICSVCSVCSEFCFGFSTLAFCDMVVICCYLHYTQIKCIIF